MASGFNWKYDAGEILLDPGDRVDVVAAVPAAPRPACSRCGRRTSSDTERAAPDLPTVPVAHFNVTGSAARPYTIGDGTPLLTLRSAQSVETLGAPTGTLLDPATFAPAQARD